MFISCGARIVAPMKEVTLETIEQLAIKHLLWYVRTKMSSITLNVGPNSLRCTKIQTQQHPYKNIYIFFFFYFFFLLSHILLYLGHNADDIDGI
jgi:hypothetical protein